MRVSAISSYIPTARVSTPRQVIQKLQYIALPAVALALATMATKVDAIDNIECLNNCNNYRNTHPLVKLICQVICGFFSQGWN